MFFNLSIFLQILHLYFPESTLAHDPIPINEFECTETGFFPYPNNKQKFYECSVHPSNPNVMVSRTYTCPQDECFDNDHRMKCSTEACSRRDNGTNDFACLKKHLQRDAQKICEPDTLKQLEMLMPKMVEFTASRGTPFENLKMSLRDINFEMRKNYAEMIENTGKNVFPLMVATDGEPDYLGVGGVFKIYFKDGSMKVTTIIAKANFMESLKST